MAVIYYVSLGWVVPTIAYARLLGGWEYLTLRPAGIFNYSGCGADN